MSAIANLPVPVIAAVHGYCIGGAVDLITACDVRLCSSDAVFSVREAKIAIVADIGRYPAPAPDHRLRATSPSFTYTGKDIDASRAAQIGLVNDVCGGDAMSVYEAATALAGEIAANSPLAVRGTKAVLAATSA